jgi:hypothetical protein
LNWGTGTSLNGAWPLSMVLEAAEEESTAVVK